MSRAFNKPAPTVLEQVQCLGAQSMKAISEASKDREACSDVIAEEQVRATYCLATVLARIHETLATISNDLPLAGRGF